MDKKRLSCSEFVSILPRFGHTLNGTDIKSFLITITQRSCARFFTLSSFRLHISHSRHSLKCPDVHTEICPFEAAVAVIAGPHGVAVIVVFLEVVAMIEAPTRAVKVMVHQQIAAVEVDEVFLKGRPSEFKHLHQSE